VSPFRRQLDLIATIPGASRRAAEVILAEIGADPGRVRHTGPPGFLGRDLPRQQPIRRYRQDRTHPARRPMAQSRAGPGRDQRARTKGTYLATRCRRIAARRGKKRALVAVGHSVLIAI
jgi:transposase